MFQLLLRAGVAPLLLACCSVVQAGFALSTVCSRADLSRFELVLEFGTPDVAYFPTGFFGFGLEGLLIIP